MHSLSAVTFFSSFGMQDGAIFLHSSLQPQVDPPAWFKVWVSRAEPYVPPYSPGGLGLWEPLVQLSNIAAAVEAGGHVGRAALRTGPFDATFVPASAAPPAPPPSAPPPLRVSGASKRGRSYVEDEKQDAPVHTWSGESTAGGADMFAGAGRASVSGLGTGMGAPGTWSSCETAEAVPSSCAFEEGGVASSAARATPERTWSRRAGRGKFMRSAAPELRSATEAAIAAVKPSCSYSCPVEGCSAVFETKLQLLVHDRHHKGLVIWKCLFEGCGKEFVSRTTLGTHRRSHSGEAPFVCPMENCGAAFQTKSNLNRHIKTHDDLVRFRCVFQGCGMVFSQLASLTSHTKGKHVNDRPFRCVVEGCGGAFPTGAGLRGHVKLHLPSFGSGGKTSGAGANPSV